MNMQNLDFDFDNSYAQLPERFYSRLPPTKVNAPELVIVNDELAQSLGLDPEALSGELGAELFAGNYLPNGSEPLAMAYAGHQFGSFVPELGDGRAILLGEVIDRNGIRQDIHLKGAGRTPYSRGGDGRAALGPILREYIVSSYMNRLGIPTTRALAVAKTGERVYREDVLPGAVLTRIAESHLRIGTFEYFSARGDMEALRILVDFAINRHFPDLNSHARPAQALLECVLRRQSKLVAKWISFGFIHGVMNTDNTSISGETIDYGPCAFIDTYRPDMVFSFIDHGGRYSFMNQPKVLQWNLGQLAQCLLPLIDERTEESLSIVQELIESFSDIFTEDLGHEFALKLGLDCNPRVALDLAFELMDVMADQLADFTLTFRNLAYALEDGEDADLFLKQFKQPPAVQKWLSRWRPLVTELNENADAARERLRNANPAIVARNHLVEEVIAAAESRSDFSPFHDLLAVLEDPFSERADNAKYASAPKPEEVVTTTYCGT